MKIAFGKSTFEKLAGEAAEVERRLRVLHGNDRHVKLSAAAFVAEAVEAARTGHKKLDQLEQLLTSPNVRHAASFVRRVAEMYAGRGTNNVGHWARPEKILARVMAWDTQCSVELQTLNSHGLEAMALAARVATQKWPGNFGKVENWDSYMAQFKELSAKRDDLFSKIAKAWTPADVNLGDLRSDGSAFITVKMTGGAISVAPERDLGERLVNWVLEREQQPAEPEAAPTVARNSSTI